ncbi:MAG TPA: DUF1028 domain-containing protein, partial [Dongiaceae bacterium]|nr:DUF1028 domain-containing protein [Dongiaceae bacterium]
TVPTSSAARMPRRLVIGPLLGSIITVLQQPPSMELHTFSIVARAANGDVGVAVATARPNVGSLVPWVARGVAIATQARVDTDLGRRGIALVEQGVPVDVALPALLARDPERERRQVHGLDARRGFCHTGGECVAWRGHEQGPDFSVAGNMLAGPQVIGAMASGFRRTAQLELAERLLTALEAGQAAGGDQRGKQSAALLVAAAEPRMYHNLRVDDHPEPVAELRRLFDVVVAHAAEIEREYGAEGARSFGRVKW